MSNLMDLFKHSDVSEMTDTDAENYIAQAGGYADNPVQEWAKERAGEIASVWPMAGAIAKGIDAAEPMGGPLGASVMLSAIPLSKMANVVIPNKNGIKRPLKYWNRPVTENDITYEMLGAKTPNKDVKNALTDVITSDWYDNPEEKVDAARKVMAKSGISTEAGMDIPMKRFDQYPKWDSTKKSQFITDEPTDAVQLFELREPQAGDPSEFLVSHLDKGANLISMSPNDFLKHVTRGVGEYYGTRPLTHEEHAYRLMSEINRQRAAAQANAVLNGVKFPLPGLRIGSTPDNPNTVFHDGRHRAMAALMLGQKEIPVLTYGKTLDELKDGLRRITTNY